jgi:toxin ParE1/3/4
VRRIVWSADALDEFDDIVGYIARDDAGAADRVADRIEHLIGALAELPVGRRGRVAGTYELVVADLPYIIVYALSDTAAGEETLSVLRIVHAARHWPSGEWPGRRP